MKKEIILFENKSALIDSALYKNYEHWVGTFTPYTSLHFVLELDLDEDMTEEELSVRVESGIREEIKIMKLCDSYLEHLL